MHRHPASTPPRGLFGFPPLRGWVGGGAQTQRARLISSQVDASSSIRHSRFRHSSFSSPRAFLLLDAVGALAIVTVLAMILTISLVRQHQALRTLANSREAIAIAERTLSDLQTGGRSAPDDDTRIVVTPLPQAESPAGRLWVRVAVTHRGATSQLLGIVPRKTVEVTR